MSGNLGITMPRRQLRPPIKLRKLMAPLVALCREKVLTSPPQTSGTGIGDASITIILKFAIKDGSIAYPAKGFPHGLTLSRGDSGATVKYDVKKLLSWFKSKAYCNFDASDLFAMRLPVLMRLAKLELKLDRLVEGIDADLQQIDSTDSE